MESKRPKMPLPSIDDLFSTQEERDSANQEKIIQIPLNDIVDFNNHPFKVVINNELEEMVDSIKERGILHPAIVRIKDGKYEMIAGHRRKKASELANLDTIPCIVRDLTDDEAILEMVDSNLQREKILPSERAFAYKMKLEAIKHQGKRTDLTSTQVVQKLSVEEIGKEHGDSRETVRRYIRLTELIPELLEYVDKEKDGIALSPAVELSYLKVEEQRILFDAIEYLDVRPSHSQAIRLRELSENNKLTDREIDDILGEDKPNQIPRVKLNRKRLEKVLPKSLLLAPDQELEDFLIKCVEDFNRKQKIKEINER